MTDPREDYAAILEEKLAAAANVLVEEQEARIHEHGQEHICPRCWKKYVCQSREQPHANVCPKCINIRHLVGLEWRRRKRRRRPRSGPARVLPFARPLRDIARG